MNKNKIIITSYQRKEFPATQEGAKQYAKYHKVPLDFALRILKLKPISQEQQDKLDSFDERIKKYKIK